MSLAPQFPRKKAPASSLLLTVLLLLGSATSAHSATSLSQFGITWTFDRDYPTGQFANGDYWVVGPVTIVSITPASIATHGATMNGSMVNPAVNGPQGYDSRIKANAFSPDQNVAARLPLALPAGTSLLSSESFPERATRDHPQLKTIAILTVLGEPAPDGSFRPPYIGADKTPRWNKSQLHFEKLRSLPRTADAPTPEASAEAFERPWIEQKTNWTGRYLHPAENEPTYGRDLARALGKALLTLQLDYTNAEKETLLTRLVQYGIDVYGAAAAGGTWSADGGHNQGRKMPLLLAGAILDDPAILAFADARQHFIFQEDQQTWYVSASDVGRALFRRDRRPRLPYLSADVGLAEWGEKHAGDPARDGRNWNSYYRTNVGSSILGHVLAARLMGLEEAWNWPAIFDYADRYWSMEGPHAGGGPNSIPLFVAEMWNAYRHATPAQLSDRNVATEVWQNSPIEAQTGSFTVSFDLLASSGNIDGVTGLSNGAADQSTDLAASVRLAPTGYIEASDGGLFHAANAVAYEPGVTYRVIMTVDIPSRRYSVLVVPPGGQPVSVADGWTFRPEQSDVSGLNNLGFHSVDGYHAVLNVGLESVTALLEQSLTHSTAGM